jgi:hypothetical protein
MVVTNIDNKIMAHIESVSYSDLSREAIFDNISGYLDAVFDLGFINEKEYDNYIKLIWKG